MYRPVREGVFLCEEADEAEAVAGDTGLKEDGGEVDAGGDADVGGEVDGSPEEEVGGSSTRSTLFPTRIQVKFGSACSRTSASQDLAFMKPAGTRWTPNEVRSARLGDGRGRKDALLRFVTS